MFIDATRNCSPRNFMLLKMKFHLIISVKLLNEYLIVNASKMSDYKNLLSFIEKVKI